MVFTAMTNKPKVIRPSFGDNATIERDALGAITEINPSFIDDWWDALDDEDNLDCSVKAARLGFDTGSDGDDDTIDNLPTRPDPGNVGATLDPMGLCRDYAALLIQPVQNLGDLDGDGTADEDDAEFAQSMIVHAFHWDMLDGAEMAAAAEAAGDRRPSDYSKPFAKLSTTEREDVEGFFIRGILAMGSVALEFDNDGIDDNVDTNDDGVDNPGEAVPGEAIITVKASDEVGRLIAVGRDDTSDPKVINVNSLLTPTGDLEEFGFTDADPFGFAANNSSVTATTGNSLVFDPGDDSEDPPIADRLIVRVGPEMDKIGTVSAVIIAGGQVKTLSPHHQALNFSLTDGDNLGFQIRKIDEVSAEINVHPNADLTGGGEYDFTLTVNEFGNAPRNSQSLKMRVVVVTDNVPPVFVTGQPTSHTVAERSSGDTIATFTATDANNQAVTYSITVKKRVADLNASADESDFIDEYNRRAGLIRTSFDLDSFETTGVLKIKTAKVKSTAEKMQPDFWEIPADDPDTDDVDESDPAYPPVNDFVFNVKVNDGTVDSRDSVEFTLTVSDDEDPLPGSSQVLNIAEDNAGGADNALQPAVSIEEADGGYDIDQQIYTQGGRTYIYQGETAVLENDEDDILFNIVEDSGAIYLKEPGSIDFEGGPRVYTLSVSAGGSSRIIVINVVDVDEAPKYTDLDNKLQTKDDPDGVQGKYEDGKLADADNDGEADVDRNGNYNGDVLKVIELYVLESANVGETVKIGLDAGGNPRPTEAKFAATDEDDNADNPDWSNISYDILHDADLTDDEKNRDELYAGADAMVRMESDGSIVVNRPLNTDGVDADDAVSLTLRAFNMSEASEPRVRIDTLEIRLNIIDTNVAPVFDLPSREKTHATISEGAAVGFTVHTYRATDEDGDVVEYRLRDQDDAPFFTVNEIMVANPTTGVMEPIAELNTAAGLDFETQISHTVEIQAFDTDGDTDEIVVTIDVTNANDNSPAFGTIPADPIRVPENSPRGTSLGSFAATDADGDTVTYSLSGTNAKSFHIDGYGELKTLESLDYDSNTPCSVGGCAITVVASDANAASGAPTSAHTGPAEAARTIMVLPIEDSVSTLNVTKANPVPGTTRGDPMTALGNTKESVSADVPERPADLPNATGAPMNFVETDWASWGTVLRIQVTAQSPDANCGSGNECVVISLNSDSAGDTLKVQAYRMDTPAGAASNENKFVAAVMLVELDGDATDIKTSTKDDIPVYAHGDGSVPRLQVDEEDEIEIEFYNLRGDIEVENEAPEISNFAPEHESAFDDPDVEYTFTVTDSHSGLPEPEDLPDADGDDAYMPAVALISKGQCETAAQDDSAESKARRAKLIKDGFELVGDMANISDDESLYCPGAAQSGEYDADIGGYGFAPIRDDKDFDEIDDGFDVETTIVLRENKIFYVTFVACDNAGNCSFFDPDGNDEGVELAEITVDTEDPVFVEARTGLTWDSTDNEYDDNRAYIQVIFNDLTKLNTETVEIDDFVVEGHSIKDVHVFENPGSDDVDWGDSGRYGATGHPNKRKIDRYRDIENVVFIELEDELLADETPDVTIVPNGVEDKAGNEQDDGDHEADDWISPSFTIVSIVSTRETSQDQILAGDDDEVTVVVTSDERLDSTRPTVAITYVNAPAGSVDTKGTATCDNSEGADKGSRERGEIVHEDNKDCADNGAATGGTLNNSVEKVSNTEWVVTITEPKDTGYYNFHISGDDRSSQKNPGSEGVSPGSIVTDFFDADGDVNVDDAIFFEGDINLPKPQVRVSGVSVEDNEADVEFRSPLFVELDFAANHSDNCRSADSDERLANCMNENSEYAEDNFDDIVVTSFVLDGVDLTDSVKTTDNQSFLVSLESISIGDHTAEVQAVDQAGNVFEDTLEIDFEVNDRDPFEKRLSPGWNLVSLPGEPADSSIAAVFGPGVEVRTVYSYDPVIPGGWQVAVRETLDSDWQGDLTEITGQRGYWVLSDAIQDWEVSIPRLAGGASGTGTPIQPPVIPMYAGWNLIPVTDVSGNALSAGIEISAQVYLNSLDDGLDLARVLGYDTIRNEWFTVLDMQMGSPGDLEIGSGYWVFVREAAALVPGGVAGAGGSGD